MNLDRSKLPYLYAFIAGALLPLAFAPHQLWPLAFISPTVLLWLWKEVPPKTAAILGFIFGLGFFGVGVSWVFISIHDFGNTDAPLAVFITLLFITILALFTALNGYLLKYLFPKPNQNTWLIGFPISWVLLEWVRSWLFTGFPWLYLGYTQIDTVLGNIAPILSVYGVSLAILFCCGSIIALIYGNKPQRILPACIILLAFGTGYLLQKHSNWTEREGPVKTVSLIQGNINPLQKFSPSEIAKTEAIYNSLTESIWWTDFIIWPESAVPTPLPYSQDYIKQLDQAAKDHDGNLIVGVQVMTSDHLYYNSMIALGKDGQGVYHKHHLVPFGDYLPFDFILRGLINFFNLPMSDFSAASDDQSLLSAGFLRIEPLICYEIAFPELVRNSLRDAHVIVNISEDGWFGSSWGPHQHLQIARMRAKETGRQVLRATTSGISAIIDTQGKIVSKAPQFEATTLNGEFQGMIGDTPWVKMGIWPFLIVMILAFGVGAYSGIKEKFNKKEGKSEEKNK